ncbi:hypothetical protein GQX74_002853 [Glossina fuscipes]|nr:hypothetical protein GQX74_002853 [Glossina fuscipes]
MPFKVLMRRTPSNEYKNHWFLLQANNNDTEKLTIDSTFQTKEFIALVQERIINNPETVQTKNNKLLKVVLYGLDGAITGEVKAQLIALNFKCNDVKWLSKNGIIGKIPLLSPILKVLEASLNILPGNVETLFHTVVRWYCTCENRESETSSVRQFPNFSVVVNALAV